MTLDKIYKKTILCPICRKETKINMYKKGTFKIKEQDLDMHVSYEGLNPILYEVYICKHCGYTNASKYFDKIKSIDKETISQYISTRWCDIDIPEDNTIEFAIYLYKLALANRNFYNKPFYGELAVINLRLSWLYKELGDTVQLQKFRGFALDCLLKAYLNESMPLGGLYNKAVSAYLISVLYYYNNQFEDCMKWLNNVILDRIAPEKLKDKARNLKDLINKKQ